MVIVVPLSALMEVSCVTPGICPNCRSSGAATEAAMVSALAPCRVAFTWMVGKSTCGSGATGKNGNATSPTKPIARHQQRGRDRPLDEGLGNVHDERSRLAIAAGGGLFTVTWESSRSLYWPSTTTRSPSDKPGRDDRLVAGRRPDRDRAHLDGVSRRYHPGEYPSGPR